MGWRALRATDGYYTRADELRGHPGPIRCPKCRGEVRKAKPGSTFLLLDGGRWLGSTVIVGRCPGCGVELQIHDLSRGF